MMAPLFSAQHDGAILESHVGILGKTGSGKSNLAKVIAERLLDAGERVCIVDPTGTWYGLRLRPGAPTSRSPRPSPYQVAIFGGVHGDIPIAESHGAAIAEAIGRSTTSAIIDTRTMTVGARTRFATAFAETLLQRNAGTLHVIIDEAHLFAPQGRVADPRSGEMLHAWNNLVSLGRGVGLRIIMLSQRPAKLHKDSLTQIETLIAMRLIAPQDTRAIEDWIGEWAGKGQGAEVIRSLPSLPTGTGWVWSPEAGVLVQQRFPLASTLDTGKPSTGDVELAPIDLEAIRAQLGKVESDRKANDPAELRKRVRELESQLASVPARVETKVETVVERIKVPVLNGQVQQLAQLLADMRTMADGFVLVGTGIGQAAQSITDAIARVETGTPSEGAGAGRAPRVVGPSRQRPQPATDGSDGHNVASARPVTPPAPRVTGDAPLGKAERSILAALVQYPQGRSQKQAAILTAYSSKGGGFRNALGRLRSLGYMEGGGDSLRITETGRDAAGDTTPLPTGRELLEHWMGQLGKAERLALEALANAYPGSLTQEELGSATGYEPRGGGFRNALGKLRTLELIEGSGAALRASADLVDA